MLTPLKSSEICHAAPRLIYVQHYLLLQVQTQVGQGKLLPQNEVSVRVGRPGNRVDLPVAHAQVLLQDIPHYIDLWHWEAFLLQFLLDIGGRINEMILLVHFLDLLSYLLPAMVLSVSHSD
jgi:hypothetical protein